jgi:hypothetical protein
MLVLPMAATRPRQTPSILFEEENQVSDFHSCATIQSRGRVVRIDRIGDRRELRKFGKRIREKASIGRRRPRPPINPDR